MAKARLMMSAALASAVLVAIATTASAQVTPEREPAPAEPTPAEPTPVEPGAAPLVTLGDLPSQLLRDARERFIDRDLEGSAMELRRAAALLRVEAQRARAEARRDLMAASQNLDRAATAVEAGRLSRIDQLDPILAGAEHASARAYHQIADEAWRRGDARRAGHALRASARHLEHGAMYAGAEAVGLTRDVTGDAFRVSGALVEGVGYAPREVGAAIEGVGRATDQLGQHIHRRPAERPPEEPRVEEPPIEPQPF